MRNEFAWYLNSSSGAAREAWSTAILTVDTNVLLDLYRYHTKTRESILTALESFSERVWLSHQAATEFFRNRKKVISSSETTFREAAKGLDGLDKKLVGDISQLKSHRLIPTPILDDLSSAISAAVVKARENLDAVTKEHPKYLSEDPVLERLLKLFEGRVGTAPSQERYAELLAEGRKRHEAKIPPGYLDKKKEGDRRLGDYLLWAQTIDHGKTAAAPVILVTSESDEDWWQIESGKTLGPRQEMVEEFWRATGQPVFLYQTQHFLSLAEELAGRKVSEEAVADIRSLGVRRARSRAGNSPAAEVNQIVHNAESEVNLGVLEIDLQRTVRNLTSSGGFDPEMDDVPMLAVSVISSPDGCPPLLVTAKTGTTFDFNVHLRPAEWGSTLPIGMYRIDYTAVCHSVEANPSDEPDDEEN